ncbi:MAG: hypothetical protein JXR94_23045 [Candidatus Hydrogenedentes bacterium]|nr:hypothetical protein [Candidatus Hydrogenedentota bacterium]
MILRRLFGGLIIALCVSAFAQDEGAAPAPAPALAPGSPAPEQTGPPGDVITLKSGQVIRGFQVLKETPSGYEVDILDGTITLKIPRRQVVSVDYDDIEPGEAPGAGPPAQLGKPRWITGQRIPPEVIQSMQKNIAEPPLEVEGKDIAAILALVSERAGVPIECSPLVGELPEEKRLWPAGTQPGPTLLAVLEENLLALDQLDWLFLDGRIIVSTKADAARLKAQVDADAKRAADALGAPAADGAPPPPEGPPPEGEGPPTGGSPPPAGEAPRPAPPPAASADTAGGASPSVE